MYSSKEWKGKISNYNYKQNTICSFSRGWFNLRPYIDWRLSWTLWAWITWSGTIPGGIMLLCMAHVQWFSRCGIGDKEKQKKVLQYFADTVLKVKVKCLELWHSDTPILFTQMQHEDGRTGCLWHILSALSMLTPQGWRLWQFCGRFWQIMGHIKWHTDI